MKTTDEIMRDRAGQAKTVLRGMISERKEEPEYNLVSVNAIIPGRFQPRQRFKEKELKELAESIKEAGVIQPVKVRPTDEGKYELIFGERRWRAAQLAGKEVIPAIIDCSITDKQARLQSFVENVQRDDLTAKEKANAVIDIVKNNPYISYEQIAKEIGVTKRTILKWLNTRHIPDKIYEELHEQGLATDDHVKALKQLKSDIESMVTLKNEIISDKLDGRQAIQKANNMAYEIPKATPITRILNLLRKTDKDMSSYNEMIWIKDNCIRELDEIIKIANSLKININKLSDSLGN